MSTESNRLVQFPLASFQPSALANFPPLADEKRGRFHQASLVAIDGLILGGATYLVYQNALPPGGAVNVAPLAVVVGTWMTLLYLNGLYDPKLSRPAHQLAYDLVKTAGASILVCSAIFFLVPALAVPREVHWESALLAGSLLLLRRLLRLQILRHPPLKKRALYIGPSSAGKQIDEEIRKSADSAYEVIGFIDCQEANTLESPPRTPDDGLDLKRLVRDYRINTLILSVTERIPENTLKAISDCSELGCELISTSRLYERVAGRIPVKHITHGWFVSELAAFDRVAYRIGKRSMDVGLSLLGLLATALLFPLLALVITLDSRGPILYSQIRAGKNGRPFKIYKFRTMVQDAETHGAVWAKVNDHRITKVGEFLRKTRLDELPQFYNVLIGEMSLVGPRPERPEFIEQLAKEIPFFNKRQMLLPGLTGWAQINYPYGASSEDALQKLQYDLYYLKNRSMFLDLEILLRTVSVVINKKGAR